MPVNHLRQKLGKLGERLALQFLTRKSYQLIRQNYLIRGGQIDLIMLSPQGNLIFVEVKTRLPSFTDIAVEETIISRRQIQVLRRTAAHFLAGIAFPFTTWQLDLIWINFQQLGNFPLKAKIKHYQNILEI